MNALCKILGIVDIASAVLIIVHIPSVFKYLLVVPLIIKGIFSLFG